MKSILETQTILADKLGYLKLQGEFADELDRVGRLLNALIASIARARRSPRSDESRIPNPESP